VAHLIGQGDIEDVIGVKKVVEHADDNGDGIADPNVIDKILSKASGYARGALLPGWPSQELIDELVANDPAVQNDVVEMAIGLLGKRREQLLGDDGTSVYSKWFKPAYDRLVALGKAKKRSIGEKAQDVGNNQLLRAEARPTDRRLMFGSTEDSRYPTSGGY
jgi:hypothetical protein